MQHLPELWSIALCVADIGNHRFKDLLHVQTGMGSLLVCAHASITIAHASYYESEQSPKPKP